ncbi:hypothetical protein COU76_01590 [Candidatus Peregrinibacteria bacterium CG10_big_fil_rev_8_21_14_0_10_49_10]|nr:MAG: hypothetical protein COU76_01590 [Candidatus Peregrinibacteria bacterium CG10_big_fil_rev_8_21_14_0_10_49_10]
MESFDPQTPYGKSVIALIVLISGVLLYQSFLADTSKSEFKPKENQECEGEPLSVNYSYYGGMLQPHACAPQCDDGMQHYVLYTNGKATQCQKIPGCLDWGEDQGVTCLPSS